MLESMPTSQPITPPPPPPPPPPAETPTQTQPFIGPVAPTPPEKPAKPPKPFSWKDEFADADKSKDGKLAKSELKLKGTKGTDVDKNGEVDFQEFRAAKVKANSFETLDADDSGTLDATELAKMQRYDDRTYGDGQSVTKKEFIEARRDEMRDNRDARLEARFKEGLGDKEAKKMERFAGKDGKLSAEEYVEGRKQMHGEWHEGRREMLFEAAGGEKGKLDVSTKEGKQYASYDEDGDGQVSKAEFEAGYKTDLKAARDARTASGQLQDAGMRDRLHFGKDAFAAEIKVPPSLKDFHGSREDWFISQYASSYNTKEDVPGWDNANCGPTSLTMVAAAFGKIDPSAAGADAAIEKSRALMGDGNDQTSGTSAEGIVRGAKAYGLDAHIVNSATLKDIENELAKGRLPIINGNTIREDGSIGSGHFYVCTKIENGKAYLNDPYVKSGPRVVDADKLMTSINSHFGHRFISVGGGEK